MPITLQPCRMGFAPVAGRVLMTSLCDWLCVFSILLVAISSERIIYQGPSYHDNLPIHLQDHFPLMCCVGWLQDGSKPGLEVRAPGLSFNTNLLVNCVRHQPPLGFGCSACAVKSALRFSNNQGCCWARVACSQLTHLKDRDVHSLEYKAIYSKPLFPFLMAQCKTLFVQGAKS